MRYEYYLLSTTKEPTFSQVVPIQMSKNSNVLVQSSGDNVAAEKSVRFNREGNLKLPVSGGKELGKQNTENRSELFNYRERQGVKDTETLSPKGTAARNVRSFAITSRTIQLSVEVELLSSAQSLQNGTWQASRSPGNRKTNRKVSLTGLLVEEVVKSKSLSVMGRIQGYPWREREPTYHRSLIVRKSEEPFKGRNANDDR